jgi:hypothetical protein
MVRETMNIVLWSMQILAGLAFFASGMPKALQPKEKLEERSPWTKQFSPAMVKTIGALEMLGALGLILPSLTGILPWLTPLAAIGLMLLMVGAIILRIQRKEYSQLVMPAIFFVMTAFVAYGRFFLAPI